MIETYKDSCRETANKIPGWQEKSKNELCRLCVENESNPELYNAYFAAVMYSYMGTIAKYYQTNKALLTEETCIEWLEDAVTYALSHRRWEDPDSSIYNDPNGPDKVINRILKCTRANLYQYVNRKKRKDFYWMKSLDAISELVNDNSVELMDKTDFTKELELDLKSFVRMTFYEKDYFMAYMIDCIMNENVFVFDRETQENIFSIKKLSRKLCQVGEEYCERFSEEYGIPLDVVLGTLKYFCNLNSGKLVYKIEYNLQKLRHNPYIIQQLKGTKKRNAD